MHLSNACYEGKTLVYACGSSPKSLVAENSDDFNIFYSTVPFLNDTEKNTLQGKKVFVAGGSDGASKEALSLSKLVGPTGKVRIIQDQNELLCIVEFKNRLLSAPNIGQKPECSLVKDFLTLENGYILTKGR